MTDAAVEFLLENLHELLLQQSRTHLYTDVNKQVRKVKENLRLWLGVLETLDERKGKGTGVYNLERDIRDLVCRLQDVLETYFNKVQSKRGRIMIMITYDIKSFQMVEEINSQIKSNIEVLESLNILRVDNKEEERSQSANANPETDNRQKFRYRNPLSRDEHIVGMDNELITLKTILADDRHRDICIYGMGGIGKTTLAQMLYGDTSVQYRFDICVWAKMGQDVTKENVLKNMLNQLPGGADKIKHSGLELEALKEHVYKSLKGTRYLVVLDDMWPLEDWNFLSRIFPNDQNGSKLMLTTRSREVATYVSVDDRDGFIHAKRFLSIPESSELFRMTAFLGDLDEVDSFKKQKGEEILEVCKGLPSAILALGKVLATKHKLPEWEMILQRCKSLMSRGLPVDEIVLEQSISASRFDDDEIVLEQSISASRFDDNEIVLEQSIPASRFDDDEIVLEQSISASRFDDLPYRLKPCFLYFGLFPKGSKIDVEHSYFLWMVDGLISQDDCKINETMMDLAEEYLSNLVRRKMVEVEEEEAPFLRKYKSCWVPEHMHDYCLQKGEEYFFKVLDFEHRTQIRADSYPSSSIRYPTRRLGLHLGKQDDRSFVDQFKNEISKHLRSLLLLNPHDLQMKLKWPRIMFDRKYRMMRVLSFERVDFQERGLPKGMTKLIYLKYLSFKGCNLWELPLSIGNLAFLKILDLRVSSRIIIPNVLRKMKKLVYLYLPLMFQTPNNDKLYLGSLKELEILENFDTGVCNVADLFEMTKLRHLSTTVEGIMEDLEQIIRRVDMTSEHASVLYPSIRIKNFDCYTEERHSVFRKIISCPVLQTLYMDGHLGQLPPHYKITQSLTEMVLRGSQLKEDPMTTLDKLPELQVLILQDDAFDGKKMVCVESSFKKLKRLELSTLRFLETWEVEKESMPMLSVLAVKNCRKLQIPPQHELRNRFPSIPFENDN